MLVLGSCTYSLRTHTYLRLLLLSARKAPCLKRPVEKKKKPKTKIEGDRRVSGHKSREIYFQISSNCDRICPSCFIGSSNETTTSNSIGTKNKSTNNNILFYFRNFKSAGLIGHVLQKNVARDWCTNVTESVCDNLNIKNSVIRE